jgi:hypothetical protein
MEPSPKITLAQTVHYIVGKKTHLKVKYKYGAMSLNARYMHALCMQYDGGEDQVQNTTGVGCCCSRAFCLN